MEVPHHLMVQDQGSAYPGTFFGAIPFPVHQVLETPTPAAYVHDPPNGVSWVVVDELGVEGVWQEGLMDW